MIHFSGLSAANSSGFQSIRDMGFIQTPYVKKEIHPGVLKGLDNFYLAGQWLQTPGGLPNAVITGRFAVQRLLKRNDKINTFCCLKNN